MSTSSPGTPKKCRLVLQQCLAIQLSKPGHPPDDFWMYDNGYTIFQVLKNFGQDNKHFTVTMSIIGQYTI